jgi:hypothetical protein
VTKLWRTNALGDQASQSLFTDPVYELVCPIVRFGKYNARILGTHNRGVCIYDLETSRSINFMPFRHYHPNVGSVIEKPAIFSPCEQLVRLKGEEKRVGRVGELERERERAGERLGRLK